MGNSPQKMRLTCGYWCPPRARNIRYCGGSVANHY